MLTHYVTRGWGIGSNAITKRLEIQAGAENNIDETIPGASTNLLVAYAVDVSQVKSLFLLSDKDVTVKTNNSGSPVNTFTLGAGVPFTWIVGDGTLKDTSGTTVSTDITTLYVTNAGADPALLQIRTLVDPTV